MTKLIRLEDALELADSFADYIGAATAARLKARLRVLPCVTFSELDVPEQGSREAVLYGADGKAAERFVLKSAERSRRDHDLEGAGFEV